MNMLVCVALGGAIGAVSRYWISSQVHGVVGGTFPGGTLAVNVLGCAVLGALVQVMAQIWSPSGEMRAFLTVGLLGALTTFSAFSLEVVLMLERGDWFNAGAYVILSVILCVGALMATMLSLRLVLT
jgi:CrcB protein